MRASSEPHGRIKIAYFSPVDWQWIKQRPQFLAEGLAGCDDILVFYPYRYDRTGLRKEPVTGLRTEPYRHFPNRGGRIKALADARAFAARRQIGRGVRRFGPDVVWLSMPWQLPLAPRGVPVVYDCMDDYAAIELADRYRDELRAQERALCQRADRIFVSSENLAGKLRTRYGVDEGKVCLLRNGCSEDWPLCEEPVPRGDGRFRIGYFGTVGRWFDFELLLRSLDRFEGLEYHVFGPTEEGVLPPSHPRLVMRGVVEHGEIAALSRQMDALVMPFRLNEIVLGVDPVKLYEYIALRRSILCVRYPEIERFGPFVQFYRDEEQFMDAVAALMERPAPLCSREEARAFLAQNTWAERARLAQGEIEKIMRDKR